MSPRHPILLLAALLATCPHVDAQDYLPDPAQVALALAQQPDVRAAAERVEGARAQARMLRVGSHELELSGIPQRRRVDDAPGTQRYDEWELQLSRRLRLPGKAQLDRQIGQHGLSVAELHYDDAGHQAARLLLERWMGWLRAGLVAEEAGQRWQSLTRERDGLQRRVQLGDAARLDLELLETELAQSDAQQLAASANLRQARTALAIDFPQIVLPEQPPRPPQPAALAAHRDWSTLIVQRSHEIGAAMERAARQDAVAARARAERIPDPSLGLRVLRERNGAEETVGLVFTMPIGGRYRRAASNAEMAEANARHADAAALARQIAREADLVVQQADNAVSQWQALHAARQASAAASTRMHRGWQLGELGLSEWLLAERNDRQISLAEAMARADALEAHLRVLVDSHELWHTEPATAGLSPHHEH